METSRDDLLAQLRSLRTPLEVRDFRVHAAYVGLLVAWLAGVALPIVLLLAMAPTASPWLGLGKRVGIWAFWWGPSILLGFVAFLFALRRTRDMVIRADHDGLVVWRGTTVVWASRWEDVRAQKRWMPGSNDLIDPSGRKLPTLVAPASPDWVRIQSRLRKLTPASQLDSSQILRRLIAAVTALILVICLRPQNREPLIAGPDGVLRWDLLLLAHMIGWGLCCAAAMLGILFAVEPLHQRLEAKARERPTELGTAASLERFERSKFSVEEPVTMDIGRWYRYVDPLALQKRMRSALIVTLVMFVVFAVAAILACSIPVDAPTSLGDKIGVVAFVFCGLATMLALFTTARKLVCQWRRNAFDLFRLVSHETLEVAKDGRVFTFERDVLKSRGRRYFYFIGPHGPYVLDTAYVVPVDEERS